MKEKKNKPRKVNGQKSSAHMREIRYQSYHLSKKERMFCIAKGLATIAVVSYLFYGSIAVCVLMLPYLYICVKRETNKKKEERLNKLRDQFKEGAQALLSALDTGYSVENAFSEAYKDLMLLYPDGSYITTEFKRIVQGVNMNKNVEELLSDFGERSGIEDIQNFAEIFSIAKKSGGDLVLIIRSTVHTIREKIEVQSEIATMMAGKRLEQRVMNVIPFAILAYVKLTSGGFLDAMYGNLLGIAVMSGCLIVYLAAVWLAGKIVDVEV